jgi:predicted TPR repeat methyltransferase
MGRELSRRHGANNVSRHLESAVSMHRAGRFAEAEAIYRGVLKTDPAQPDALHFLGLLEQQRGRSHEAALLIRRATEAAPGYTDAFNNLGNVLKTIGDLDQAEICYRRALAFQPRHANALSNLGAVLRAKGELDAAEAACRSAIAAEPGHVEAHNNLGNILAKQGRHDAALACYRASIALDPNHPDGPKLLGLALHALGRIDEAGAVYRQWLARDPGNPVATHMLAACSGQEIPARASDGYVKNIFDGMAGEFDQHLARLGYRAPEIVQAAVGRELPASPASLRVLDAGCGTGLCARFLRPYAQTLTGVDLSAGMLRRAAQTGLYDMLIEAELTAHLQAQRAAYDLIVCSDTLCYFGALDAVLTAAAAALRPRALLVFTVERAAQSARDAGFRLAAHGRYSHSEEFVRATLRRAAFRDIDIREAALRNEGGVPVAGLVATARAA